VTRIGPRAQNAAYGQVLFMTAWKVRVLPPRFTVMIRSIEKGGTEAVVLSLSFHPRAGISLCELSVE